jgi:carbamoyl-phosphate synthase large subunit
LKPSRSGLDASPVSQILIEESVLGWKEYELEVMRDLADNVVDYLLDREHRPDGRAHRRLDHRRAGHDPDRQGIPAPADAARKVIREIGVETGGSNIQFAVEPHNGDVHRDRDEPACQRARALASKATGFPIAKIAAKLAVGYTLDEITNDITKKTPAASSRPSTTWSKFPRFAFEKFPGTDLDA